MTIWTPRWYGINCWQRADKFSPYRTWKSRMLSTAFLEVLFLQDWTLRYGCIFYLNQCRFRVSTRPYCVLLHYLGCIYYLEIMSFKQRFLQSLLPGSL